MEVFLNHPKLLLWYVYQKWLRKSFHPRQNHCGRHVGTFSKFLAHNVLRRRGLKAHFWAWHAQGRRAISKISCIVLYREGQSFVQLPLRLIFMTAPSKTVLSSKLLHKSTKATLQNACPNILATKRCIFSVCYRLNRKQNRLLLWILWRYEWTKRNGYSRISSDIRTSLINRPILAASTSNNLTVTNGRST